MKDNYNIFFSWQSDLPKETNQNAIRECLRNASSLVENEFEHIRIVLDEATRGTAGSPNIPLTIFSKIDACDIFICDVTTINFDQTGKKTPNPNVLIELGYAVSTLGWERIILLYNTDYGNFPNDLPFDIDRHRATTFKIENKLDKSGKNQLSNILNQGITTILNQSPLKPSEKLKETPEEKKRRIDIMNLKWLLQSIHIPTFDEYFEEAPDRILKKIFFYKEGLSSIIDSNSFHLYDKKLLKIIEEFRKNLDISLSFGQHYLPEPYSKYYKFQIPFDVFRNDKEEKDFNYLVKIRTKLIENFKDLLSYVRNEYLEIDLSETDNLAHEAYVEMMEK
ncbi:nucleotide-binding protein [Aureisphaera sp. CAU 1614]|uniref:Nucleotide-binding protein n=1 Tax=Halomarinibacterium sedimenti TaxID=2857106 RepID=A0A9X1JXE7_9FLAO|nr:nucleotide-binding protein [Halomarinibacterium sedimenti]MBW2936497.1 nucleotide-binding protein [Halomarinibacterium sedimenti]